MKDLSSRHRRASTYRREIAPDVEIELLEPRSIDVPAGATFHVVEAGDRLDLLAHRYYGDPLQYWRIADANPTESPADLLERGRVLHIPGATSA